MRVAASTSRTLVLRGAEFHPRIARDAGAERDRADFTVTAAAQHEARAPDRDAGFGGRDGRDGYFADFHSASIVSVGLVSTGSLASLPILIAFSASAIACLRSPEVACARASRLTV